MTVQRSASEQPDYPGVVLTKNKFDSLLDLRSGVLQQKLKQKLWAHKVVINPELLQELEQSEILNEYLDHKVNQVLPLLDQLLSEQRPEYAIEELCLKALTADILPSAFQYNLSVLRREFGETYRIWAQDGTLTHEIINFHRYCRSAYKQEPLVAKDSDEPETYRIVTSRIRQFLWEQTLAGMQGRSFPD